MPGTMAEAGDKTVKTERVSVLMECLECYQTQNSMLDSMRRSINRDVWGTDQNICLQEERGSEEIGLEDQHTGLEFHPEILPLQKQRKILPRIIFKGYRKN